MGRGRRRAGPPRGAGESSDRNVWNVKQTGELNNARFEEYYRRQGIIPEEEWPSMLASLRTDLPTTFRVTGSRAHAETINDTIQNSYVPTMQDVEVEGKRYEPPRPIPWYPGFGWQLDAPKRVVRKTEPFKRFQRFLVGETEVGNLSRQEAVSMIPPLFLDVQPHHCCLDMCAAPGSKTAQIIEALNPHHTTSSGLLVANDSDYKRTQLLVHQTGRMPSRGLMVTNLDASAIPTISLGGGKTLQFDRILADVPCSGDGTLRKNVEIWSKWGVNDGNSLHSLQLRILDRGMRMLKPGGRLVYSTCSFNPIENEAVVAAGLNAHPGKFALVDVSSHLPALRRRKGMTAWKVATYSESPGKTMMWHDSYEAYRTATEASRSEKDRGKGLVKTAFTPENAADLSLQRCLRLVPHDQDTGGFFACVLQRTGEETAASASSSSVVPVDIPPAPPLDSVTVADETGSSSVKRAASPSIPPSQPDIKRTKSNAEVKEVKVQKKQMRDLMFREDPFSFVDPEHGELRNIKEYFKLDEKFAKDQVLVRNEYGDPLRTLYLANDTVKAIIQNNDYTRLRVTSAGVKAFVKQDSSKRPEIPCKWRISIDGMLEVVPHLGQDIIREAGLEELRILLEEYYPPIVKFGPSVQAWMNAIPLGNVIVRFAAGDGAGGHLPLSMCLPVWKAKQSMCLLIDKREKSMLSLRTFGQDICKPPSIQHSSNGKNKAHKGDDAELGEGQDGAMEETKEQAKTDVNVDEQAGIEPNPVKYDGVDPLVGGVSVAEEAGVIIEEKP